MTDERQFVCEEAVTVAISNVNTYVLGNQQENPICHFNRTKLEIIRAGSFLNDDNGEIIGRLLIVGAVSAFENYCRGILSGCLFICPISQGKSSDKNVSLGGAIWHGPYGNFNRSAFEHKSFADAKELKSAFREFIGFELNGGSFETLLNNFEVVMQLRHAIVHADGILPGRNAVKLEVLRTSPELKIVAKEEQVQECLLVLTNLVLAINRELFSLMCKRWATDWRLRSDWQPNQDNRNLNSIFKLFIDRAYHQNLPSPRKWKVKALTEALKSKYGLA